MIKKLLIILLVTAFALTATACAATVGNDGGSGGYTFTDSEGASVTIPQKPQKVAVLFSSYADIWVAAGGSVDVTVNETVERGFADETAVLVDGGSGHSTIDMETLVAEKPDLVIGTADYDIQREAVEFCRTAGIPSALFRVESFEDYLEVLRIFCDITGQEDCFVKYGTEVEEKINGLLSGREKASPPQKILFIRAGSSAKSTKAKTTEDNFVCAMLSELGTENIADFDSTLTGTLSLESILKDNPDYLFISTMGDEVAATDYMNSLLTSEGWRELECVKSGNYCFLPKDLFHFKPNAHWAEAYEYLIAILC